MDDPEKWAICYLAARRQATWRWADDGDTVVLRDGTTIAFRQEILFALEWLAPHGWPPFGSLVWLLAACRAKLPLGCPESGDGGWQAAEAGAGLDDAKQLMLKVFRDRQQHMHGTVENGLKAIANLPAHLRSSLQAKATLAEMVFGRIKPKPQADAFNLSQQVLAVLRSGVLTDTMLNDPGSPPPPDSVDGLALYEGLAQLPLDSLELRLRTGIDAIPHSLPIPLPPAARVQDVLKELRADTEHAGLARLVRDFMAAIQLPRRLSEQDEMPIGGFADITNRGNPDRLLLSELAHDDLTLAVRVAANEALYLRREPLAKQPPSTLAILLDSGVRLWGVPRVLATAAALALVAKDRAHGPCAVFRARGNQLQSVDLLSKEGVIAHLGALEPHAHPGPALAAFRARLGDDEHAEAVLITHRDVWADPDFQRDLALAKFAMLYLALVDRDGSFTLLRYPRGGRALCEARVNIEALFPPPAGAPQPSSLIDRASHPELPLILSVQPFPLLISVHGKVQKAIRFRGGGGACVTRDRRLLAWRSEQRGARTIASELPHGRTLWLGKHDDGTLCVVKTTNQHLRLACRVYSLEGSLLHSHDWEFSEVVIRVESRGDVIFIICANHAQVRDMKTGEALAQEPVSRASSHGRYFFSHAKNAWCVLSWDGQALRLDPLLLLAPLPHRGILRVFNNHDSAGPWVLMRNGDVYGADGKRVMQLGALKPLARISEDGRRLLVASEADGQSMVVDLSTRKQWPVQGAISDRQWMWTVELPVRPHFDVSRIGFLSTGRTCLESGNHWFWIEFLPGNPRSLQWLADTGVQPENIREFTPVPLAPQTGYSLKVAQWEDGRRAWFDDRGMLHLKCANPALPELTICTCHEMFAMWSSNGQFWGHPFFNDNHPCAPPEVFWDLLRAFAKPAS